LPITGDPGRRLAVERESEGVVVVTTGGAAKIVLEPIFEADFLPSSFGFRPKRSAHQALEGKPDGLSPSDLAASRTSGLPHQSLF
jgi:hypothetical protein